MEMHEGGTVLPSHVGPRKAPAQKSEEGLGASPAWEKVPTFLSCVLPPKAGQKESRMGLTVWLNVVMKAWPVLVPPGGDSLLRREKPSSKLAGKPK